MLLRPAGLLRGPQFQSQGRVSPCTFRASQTHSWVREVLPMRNNAVGVCLRGLGAMLGSPGRGHLAHPMAPRGGVMDRPLAGDIPKRGAKLALSEGGNSNGVDFQAVARSHRVRAPRRVMRILAPVSRGTHRVFSLQDPRMLQTDLGSLAVARLHRFSAPERNRRSVAPRSSMQVHAQGVSP